MVNPHGVDADKLSALLTNPTAGIGYRAWLDQFIIPLLKKVGLKVRVKRSADSYAITVKLPSGAP